MKMVLYKTVRHFFPSFNSWVKGMDDPRNKKSTDYPLPVMVWIGLLLFILKLGSRRQINFQLNTDTVVKNLPFFTEEELERIAHDGTLAYLLQRLPPNELYKLRAKMINELIRKKCLVNHRLLGYYLIVADGTGYLTFKDRHCEYCLERKRNGETVCYYHPVVEAKLVLSNGMALSIETEFIENQTEEATVQDCELRAFYRLEKRLKERFPQLKICLLLDSLYANGPVFDVCEENDWKYIITFKEGSMPATYKEYLSLKKISQDCRLKCESENLEQDYQWVNAIDYEERLLNVLECKETKAQEEKRHVWITNFNLDGNNVQAIANKGGRLRWKIENEGFNMQKNGGYNLEHPYSKHQVAMKNFYLLLQIAHIISQLMEKGNLLKVAAEKLFGSIRNFSRRLLEDLRNNIFDPTEIAVVESSSFQIRLRGP